MANYLGQPFPQPASVNSDLLNYLGQVPQQPQPRPFSERLGNALMTTWPAQMAKSAFLGATLPGDVYAGRVDPMSDEALGRSVDLAGLATLGSGAFPAASGELRAGVKLRSGVETPETDLAWYFKDVKPKPNLTAAENKAFANAPPTYESVSLPIGKLNATQPTVNPDFAVNSTSHGELPFVIRKNGEFYVTDGHHRATKAYHEGSQNVRVRLMDFDKKDTSTPLLDWPKTKQNQQEVDDLLRDLFGK